MKSYDTWVCNWCGSDEVYEKVFINMNTDKQDYGGSNEGEPEYATECGCNEFEKPITEDEWQEKVAEATIGNKDEYHKILDGGRL